MNPITISKLADYPNRILWNMNRECNLRCSYCYYQGNEENYKDQTPAFSASTIYNGFKSTNKKWLILLSGGEPFLYPNIYEVLELLAQDHDMQITTNLSLCDVNKFKHAVAPEKIMNISASVHLQNRSDDDLKLFIEKYTLLKNAGYCILANIVAYPPLISQIEKNVEWLKEKGVEDITLLSYRGVYNKKNYPDSYTESELSIIKKFAIDPFEMAIAKKETSFYGRSCEAGNTYFSMLPNGDIQRCGTLSENYGNLFDGTFSPDLNPKPCTANYCYDCYLGKISVNEKKANMYAVIKEKLFAKHRKK